MGWAGNMYHAVERWIEAEQHLATDLRQQIPDERKLEVRYEDLIVHPGRDPDHHLPLPGHRLRSIAIFDYADTSTYDLPDAQADSRSGNENSVTDEDIQLAESRISEMLVERGYELSGLPLLDDLRRREAEDWLAIQDRIWRARFRMRRYGLPLFATDYLARRLPLEIAASLVAL